MVPPRDHPDTSPDPEDWNDLDALLAAALERAPAERDDFLVAACAGQPDRLRLLRSLLQCHEDAARELGDSAAAFAAPLLEVEDEGAVPPGERIGPYRVVREVGRGGMGIVYLAERADDAFSRRVAVKVVKRGMDTDEVLRRFRRERQILAALEHPNIARLYDGGATADGQPYLVMEYLEGVPIDRFCEARRLDINDRLALVVAVCRAVHYAHEHLVVHRDIKPSNILVTEDGSVRLLDFGIAKLLSPEIGESVATRTGLQLLTPEYSSPEQVRGAPVTPQTDVHALGILLYELLTGERPFAAPGTAPDQIARLVLTAVPDPPSRRVTGRSLRLRGDLDAVVLRALEKNPAHRHPTAASLAEDLERHREGQRVSKTTRRARLRRRAASLRRPALISLGILGSAALAAAGLERMTVGRTAPRTATLAVMDLSVGPDSSHAYLATGLTEELTTRLARLRRLEVKGRHAVGAALQRADGDPTRAGRALGVQYLLEGTLAPRDSLLRLTLRLVSAADGYQRWVEEFRFPPAQALAIQDSIVRHVGRTVGERLGVPDVAGATPRITEHAGAYDQYLRGNYELARRTPASVLRAIAHYRKARALDPGFTGALSRHAYAIALMVDWGWPYPGRTREQLIAEALDLTDRGLDEDPSSPDVWLARAYSLVVRDPVRHLGAVTAFERVVALDSTSPEAWHQYGQTLMVLGRFEEALAAYQRVVDLDAPLPTTLVAMAAVHRREGRYAEARRHIDRAVAQEGVAAPYALALRGVFSLEQGAPEAAETDARRALALDTSFSLPARGVLARALLAQGDTTTGRVELERAISLVDTLHPSPTEALWLGRPLLDFGGLESALALLERARPHGAQLWFYLVSSAFDGISEHPRYQALLRASDPR